MEQFDGKAHGVILSHLDGSEGRMNFQGGEQHPGEGLFAPRRMGLVDIDGVEGKGGKRRIAARGFEGDFGETDFDLCGSLFFLFAASDENLSGGGEGLGFKVSPQMLLRVIDSSIPGGSDQQFRAAAGGLKEQFIDIGLAVGDVDELSLENFVLQLFGGAERMEPFLAFFIVDGFFASLLGAAVVGAGPGLLRDDAQRQPLRGQSQGGMEHDPARSKVGTDVT